MTTKDNVIALLSANNEYVSGEKISERLGISRAAVNTAVKSLRAEGYDIRSSTNKGYILTRSPDILSCGLLSRHLGTGRTDSVLCLNSVDSTNNYLRKLATEGAPAGQIVIAESQTAGRGRLGRRFASPESKGIYMSMLLRPQNAIAEDVSSVSAWVAAAVHNAIFRACGVRSGIKWVNDLTLDAKKLCGILTEISIESENRQIQYMIVGVGVNVNETTEDFPDEYRDIATSLRLYTGTPHDRVKIAAEMIRALDELARDLPHNKQPYLDTYRAYNVTTGKDVRLLFHNGDEIGYAVGIDDDFGLIVRNGGGEEKTVRSGEVSVRGLYGYV